MSTTVEKEWLAIDADEQIAGRADTLDRLLSEVATEPCPECGRATTEYDIVAVPKPHASMFI